MILDPKEKISQRNPEEFSVLITDVILKIKNSFTKYKQHTKELETKIRSLPTHSSEREVLEKKLNILNNFVNHFEIMLLEFGAFTDNLSYLIENYDSNRVFYNELLITLNNLLPLITSIEYILTGNPDINMRLRVDGKQISKAEERGDSVYAYMGDLEMEGKKYLFSSLIRPVKFSNGTQKKEARVIFSIRENRPQQIDDTVTIRLDHVEYFEENIRKQKLMMDLTFPESQRITTYSDVRDSNQTNPILIEENLAKKEITDALYEDTSQEITYHFLLNPSYDRKKFEDFSLFLRNIIEKTAFSGTIQ